MRMMMFRAQWILLATIAACRLFSADAAMSRVVQASFEEQPAGAAPLIEKAAVGKVIRSLTLLESHKDATITVEKNAAFGGKVLLFDNHLTDRTGIKHSGCLAYFRLAEPTKGKVSIRMRFLVLAGARNSFMTVEGASAAKLLPLMISADRKVHVLLGKGSSVVRKTNPGLLKVSEPSDIAISIDLDARTWELSVNGERNDGDLDAGTPESFYGLNIAVYHGELLRLAVDDVAVDVPASEVKTITAASVKTKDIWGRSADGSALETAASYPIPRTRWVFSKTGFSIASIRTDGGEELLKAPGGVFFRDGKNNSMLTPRTEKIMPGSGVISVEKDLGGGLTSSETVRADKGMIRWRIVLNNSSRDERWTELNLSLPFDGKGAGQYFDGYTAHSMDATNVWRTQLEQTFPVSFCWREKNGTGSPQRMGLAFGVTPNVETSILHNGLIEGAARYLTRLVVEPGYPAAFEFVLFTAEAEFGHRDAMQGYYQCFPDAFKPFPGVDPRMTAGDRADSLQRNHYNGGAENAGKAADMMSWYSGIEWAYAISKRGGDLYGHKELWDSPETPGIIAKMSNRVKASGYLLDLFDHRKYHEGKRTMWERADFRGNVALTHFMIDFVEKGIVDKYDMMKYTYPDTDDTPALRSTWGFEYCSQLYHVYPWANPYEEFMKRDIPLLVEELNLPGIAHDMFNEPPNAPLYRGPLDRHVNGWSYDAKGKCISRLLAYRKIPELCHTLTNANGHAVGVFANGIVISSALTFAYPDCWLTETRPTKALIDNVGKTINWGRGNYKHARNFAGSRPVYQHASSSVDLGDLVDWASLTTEETAVLIDDFFKDMVTWYYQTGILPSNDFIGRIEAVWAELPFLYDVLSRGFQPSPIIAGDDRLERVRYGSGLGSAVVISSREKRTFTSREAVLNGYIGSGYAIPFSMKGKVQTFTCKDGITAFDMSIDPLENRIYTLTVSLGIPVGAAVSGKSEMKSEPSQRKYRIVINAPSSMTVPITAAADPAFSIEALTCNGAPVKDSCGFKSGENTIVLTTRSSDFLSPIEDFISFPYDSASITVLGPRSKRRDAAGMNIRDMLAVRRKVDAAVQGTAPDGAAIVIGTATELGRTGVWVDGNKLYISGSNDFDAQQRGWKFMRLIERHDERFAVPKGIYLSGNKENAAMFQKAGLLGKYITMLDRSGKERFSWQDHFRSDLKSKPVVDDMYRAGLSIPLIKLPSIAQAPVLDGKLDDAVWRSAAVISSFHMNKAAADDPKPTQKTEALYYRGKDHFFIGFKCHEANMDRTFTQMTERDSAVWNDDCVEIRLAPGAERNAMRFPCYTFLFNQACVCFDMLTDPNIGSQKEWKLWDGNARSAVHKGADYWSIEVMIPLDDMKGSRDVKTWRFQFSRTEKPNNEYSVAVPMPGAGVAEQMLYGALSAE